VYIYLKTLQLGVELNRFDTRIVDHQNIWS
jgi:hypothetical protein